MALLNFYWKNILFPIFLSVVCNLSAIVLYCAVPFWRASRRQPPKTYHNLVKLTFLSLPLCPRHSLMGSWSVYDSLSACSCCILLSISFFFVHHPFMWIVYVLLGWWFPLFRVFISRVWSGWDGKALNWMFSCTARG